VQSGGYEVNLVMRVQEEGRLPQAAANRRGSILVGLGGHGQAVAAVGWSTGHVGVLRDHADGRAHTPDTSNVTGLQPPSMSSMT
jgi:hypothetical protein